MSARWVAGGTDIPPAVACTLLGPVSAGMTWGGAAGAPPYLGQPDGTEDGMRVVLVVMALAIGGAGYALWGAHQAAEAERARVAAGEEAFRRAIEQTARLLPDQNAEIITLPPASAGSRR